jgi:nucleoid-associated protein YgaU
VQGSGDNGSFEQEPAPEERHVVEEGETLQSLAARFYGSAREWRRLYEANREVLGEDPNLPRPGVELRVPR